MASNKEIIIDSGYFIALGNVADQHHKRAIQLLQDLSDKRWITTWPVLVDVCHLLSQISPAKVPQFMQNLEEGAFEVFSLTKEDAKKLKLLMIKYVDLPMDLADASLVLLAEHLGHGQIVSTDRRDFKTYRWKQHHPFENLF